MFRRPLLPLLLLGGLFLVLPLIRWTQLPDPDFYPRNAAFTFATALLCLISFPVKSVSATPLRLTFVGLAVIGFLVWTLLRTSFEGPALAVWLRWCSGSVFVLVLSTYFRKNPQSIRYLPRILAVFNLLLLASFLFQVFGDSGFNFPIRYDHGGWAGNKNYLSEALFIASFFLAMGWNDTQLTFRLLIRFTLVSSVVAVLVLQSVSVWFALSVAVFLTLIGRRRPASNRYRKVLVLLSAVVFASAVLYIPAVRKRVDLLIHHLSTPADLSSIDPVNDNSVYERLLMYRNSLDIIREHPITGCGLTRWTSEQAKFGVGGTRYLNTGLLHFEHPHNEYLLVLSETGAIGLLLLFLLVYGLLRKPPVVDTQLRWSRLGMIGTLLIAVFAYPLSRDLAWCLFLLHAAVWLSGRLNDQGVRLSDGWRIPFWAVAISLTVANACVLVSGIRSEFHLGQSAAAALKKDYARAVREARSADGYWYVCDRTGTPVDWYVGDAAFRSGDVRLASFHLKRARMVDPYHPRVLNDLGTIYEQTGHPDSAIVCYREALRSCPGMDEAKLNMAATYFNNGQVTEAYAALKSIRYPDSLKGRDAKNYREFLPVIEHANSISK
ncbi:MAG: hypothetical protein RL021_389 [Bacteroidota bacterium]